MKNDNRPARCRSDRTGYYGNRPRSLAAFIMTIIAGQADERRMAPINVAFAMRPIKNVTKRVPEPHPGGTLTRT